MQILDADQYFIRSTVCTKQWVENVYILTVQINFIFPFLLSMFINITLSYNNFIFSNVSVCNELPAAFYQLT